MSKIIRQDRPTSSSSVKLATLVEGNPKAPFSIATTPKCRGGCYSLSWIAPLYLDVAQGHMKGAPNETQTHSCRFASRAC